ACRGGRGAAPAVPSVVEAAASPARPVARSARPVARTAEPAVRSAEPAERAAAVAAAVAEDLVTVVLGALLPLRGTARAAPRAARVTDAHRAREVRGVPGEPGGGVRVGGAGLPGRRPPDAAHAAHRALGEHAGEDRGGGVGDLGVEHLLALGPVLGALAVPVD